MLFSRYILFGALSAVALHSFSQVDITPSKSTFCINETIVANELNYVSGDSIVWDFCSDDIHSDPVYDQVGTITSFCNGFDLAKDGNNWYGFSTAVNSFSLYRLYYGDSLGNTPTVTNLGNIDGELSFPDGIKLFKYQDLWYGVVGYSVANEDVTLLKFGNSLANTPQAYDLGNDGYGGRFREIEIIEFENQILMLAPNSNLNRLIIFELADIDTSTPSMTNAREYPFTNFFGSRGITYIKDSGEVILFIIAESNTEIMRVRFSDLLGSPDEMVKYSYSGIVNPYRIKHFYENDSTYLFITNDNTEPVILSLNNSLEPYKSVNHSVTLENYTDVEVIKEKGQIATIGTYYLSSVVRRHIYNRDCNDLLFSDEVNPIIDYSSSGNKIIESRIIRNDTLHTESSSLNVLNSISPEIRFEFQNICVTSALTFSPTNTGLTTYSWDFDDDGIEDSDEESPQVRFDTLAGVGEYTVRVDVNDGTCDNFYEEVITIYPEPPVPAFTVASTECVNTDIDFTNDTNESQHTGVISYMWDFDNDGTIDSTEPNPTYAYTTPGTKTVVLYDTIPGCSNVSTTFEIEISTGPTSDFTQTSTSACEGETITFSDNSSGAIAYSWDFDNGFTSAQANPPAQLFENSGSYFVSLVTTDSQGCTDSLAREISISSTPEINIDFDVPCTSPDGVQFFDLSTVAGADILSWSWEVDGEEVSTQQNPLINFSSTGVKTIGLTVLSSNGCEQYSTEDIEVLAAPSPDFSINLGCQGEESTFTDETISPGNPIVSWLWTVDGVNYGTQDISHVFTDAGSYEVMLEVTGQNFCSEAITQTVEVIELPQVAFTVNGECDNQIIRATDQSTASADPVISRRWNLDGVNVGNGSQLLLNELEDDSYELELELETESGCVISSTQMLEINDAPTSAFTSSRTYGVPNDRLTFTNSSSGAISYQWLLDDIVRSSSSDSESITFVAPGLYDVSLVAQNSLGCYDTTTQEIRIAIPEVDLSIGSFELVAENNTGRIFLEVQNFSNLPVEITEAQITLENEFSVTEQILEFIDVGESRVVNLNVGIPLTISEPSYFCVNLSSQYIDYDDVDPVNNEKCLTIQPIVQVEDPFPNPVSDEFRLKVISPTAGNAMLRVMNSAGEIMREQSFQTEVGLNNFFIDVSFLNSGIYYVSVTILGDTYRRKVIKL